MNSLILYSITQLLNGNMGSFGMMTALCSSDQMYVDLGCSQAYPFLTVDGIPLSVYPVPDRMAPVVGPYGTQVFAHWSDTVNYIPTDTAFAGTDICNETYWFGSDEGLKCTNWRSEKPCVYGMTHSPEPGVVIDTCDSLHRLVCVCIGGMTLPSTAPTALPSAMPTVSM